MEVRKEDFHPNLRRKVEAMDLPKQVSARLKSETTALKFERLRNELRDRSGNNGDQKTIEFILELAWMKYLELEEIDEEIGGAVP